MVIPSVAYFKSTRRKLDIKLKSMYNSLVRDVGDEGSNPSRSTMV